MNLYQLLKKTDTMTSAIAKVVTPAIIAVFPLVMLLVNTIVI